MAEMDNRNGSYHPTPTSSGHDVSCGADPRSLHRLTQPSRERGQELVEFAIIVPLFILFLFGIYDLGRAFHAVVVITNAAREGARYAVIHQGMGTPYSYDQYMSNIIDTTRSEALTSGINLATSTITVSCPIDNKGTPTTSDDICQHGQPVRVTISYRFPFFMQSILPTTSLNIVRFAEMMIP